METLIHPLASIDPTANLGQGVQVGAFAVVEAGVQIGDRTQVGHHAVVHSGTTLGQANQVFPHAVVGGAPQDLKYAGQPTRLEVGDNNMIREFTTLNRGTAEGGGLTRIGSNNLFMAYVHVAHDCVLADNIVLANSVAIAGHGHVDSFVVIGGMSGLHQFGRIGTGAMVGAMARLSKDVAPFSTTAGTDDVKVYGLNKVGLRRRGFPRPEVEELERAYRIYLDSTINFSEALAKLEALPQPMSLLRTLIEFLKVTNRGIYR